MKRFLLIILALLAVSGCSNTDLKEMIAAMPSSKEVSEETSPAIQITETAIEETETVAVLTVAETEIFPDAIEETGENTSDYILPESGSRIYTPEELSKLSSEELRIARNEIYARHGRIFDSPDLRSYFESKMWYKGTVPADSFDDGTLTDIERENVKLILAAEEGTNTVQELTGTYLYEKNVYTTGNEEPDNSGDTIEIIYADSERIIGIYKKGGDERNCDWSEYAGQEIEFSTEKSLGFGGIYGNQDMVDYTSVGFSDGYLIYFEDGADASWWFKKIK